MKDKELQFDRACHVLYSKPCKKKIKANIALHYPAAEQELFLPMFRMLTFVDCNKPLQFFCRSFEKNLTVFFDMYSWNMDFFPYPDGSGYESRFTKCGICTLMRELGLFDLVPAMCALDYAMSEAGGASHFVRECTLAGGDEYCDCGYKKRTEG